jgi:hypothetical protein
VDCLDSSLGSGIGSWGSDAIAGSSGLNILLGLGSSSSSWGTWVGIVDVDTKALKVDVAQTPDEDGTEDGY